MKNFGLDLTASKINLSNYYERLSTVRKTGDWEGWLEFILTGVAETAGQVVETQIRQLNHEEHEVYEGFQKRTSLYLRKP